ncbi:MAG: P-loop NTPase [SAR324 cluster bacterium]
MWRRRNLPEAPGTASPFMGTPGIVGQIIRDKEIIAIGGGKGGVGKTLLAGNLGILFAKMGKTAVLIDADLGGANLHTCLGIPTPELTLSDFMTQPHLRIEDVMLRTAQENLFLISGAQDILNIANPTYNQKGKLLRAVQELMANYIVLDLGAGTSTNTLDFFLLADKGVLVVMPEPTSIENAYRFIKSAIYRRLRSVAADPRVRAVIDKAMDKKNDLGVRSPVELVDYVTGMDARAGGVLKQALRQFRPRIVVNQVRSLGDVRIGYAMQSVCQKFFGIQVEFIGYLENDEQIWQSIRKRQPIALTQDQGRAARNLRTIAYNLMNDLHLKPE